MVYTINGVSYDSDYLAHYGILGMKWGVRRYQNKDGSYTNAGRKRYGIKQLKSMSKEAMDYELSSNINDPRRKTVSEIMRKAESIAEKYGLDKDDGGGGDDGRYTEKQLEDAAKQYLHLWDEYNRITEEIFKDSHEEAKIFINEKYGADAFDAISSYDRTTSNLLAAAFIATIGALVIAPSALRG